MQELYKKILEKNKRILKHHFTVTTLKWYDQWLKTFSGKITGEVVWPPRGQKGFGYDPFFVPSNFKQTFGEMVHKKN